MSFIYQHRNKLLDNTNYGMNYSFGLPNLCTTMYTCHSWYNVHNKKTSKILIFKVIIYGHKFPCTLNSVVFELSFCLPSWNLLWWHSGCIPLGWSGSWSVIQDHSCGSSKEPMNLWPERIHQFHWCTSDLGSLILIQITPKKCTLHLYWTFC